MAIPIDAAAALHLGNRSELAQPVAAIADKIYFTGGSSTTTTWLGTPVAVL